MIFSQILNSKRDLNSHKNIKICKLHFSKFVNFSFPKYFIYLREYITRRDIMVHGFHPLLHIQPRMPMNERVVINNYNNYSHPPMLSFMNRPYAGYPFSNDYYYGRDPYMSYYAAGGAFTLGCMIGSGVFSGIRRGIKNFFSWIGRGITKTWNWITGKNKKENTYVPANNSSNSPGSTRITDGNGNVSTSSTSVNQTQIQTLSQTNGSESNIVEEVEENDKNVYSSSVKTSIKNMRRAKNSYDLLMAINDASMELTGLSGNITKKTDAFVDEYKEINGEDYISKTKEQEKTVKNLQNEYNEALRQENAAQANYNKAYSDVQQARDYLKSINDDIAKFKKDLNKPLTDETKTILEKNLQAREAAKTNAERDLNAKEKSLADKNIALNTAKQVTQVANTQLEKEKQTLKEINVKKTEIEQMEKDRDKLDKTITNQQKRLIKLSKRENNKMYGKQVRETRNDDKAQVAADKGNIGKTGRKENTQSTIQDDHTEIQSGHVDLYSTTKFQQIDNRKISNSDT